MSLVDSVKKQLAAFQQKSANCWIAYSGGVDSHVLLDVCVRLRSELNLELKVIHVNHGLSSNASRWRRHCEAVCKQYGVPLHAEKVSIAPLKGESLEAAARDARYGVFSRLMQPGHLLLTAQHQEDQAETFLLQMLRGAGIKGLASMPAIKPFAGGQHMRPLLSHTKQSILQYAHQQSLRWVEDDSNSDMRFARNFIRQSVLPVLQRRWPKVSSTIARSAAHCADSAALLNEIVSGALIDVQGSGVNTLSVKRLLLQKPNMRALILREWIVRQNYILPDHRKMQTIQECVLTANWDRMPAVEWEGVSLRRYGDDLFLCVRELNALTESSFEWSLDQPLALPCIGELTVVAAQGEGLKGDLKSVTVRFREGGEVIKKDGIHQSLKKLFQVWRIPPWERDKIPLLFESDRLVAVVGYLISDDDKVSGSQVGRKVTLIRQEKRAS